MSEVCCPVCGSEYDWAVVFACAADGQALARLVAVSVPLGARVLQYVGLHTPAKQRLTAAKKIKLILQLLPDLERKAITHKGRDWTVPLALWAAGIDQMLEMRDAARLDLPLRGHGYLYAVLADLAGKSPALPAAAAVTQSLVTVRGQSLSIGEGLQVAYAGKDPALAALADRDRQAAPMPDHIRQKIAALRGKGESA